MAISTSDKGQEVSGKQTVGLSYSHRNKNVCPEHGPFGIPFWNEDEKKWNFKLTDEGLRLVEVFLKKYPEPQNLIANKNFNGSKGILRKFYFKKGPEKKEQVKASAIYGVYWAAAKFKPELGNEFSTYVVYAILEYIKQDADRNSKYQNKFPSINNVFKSEDFKHVYIGLDPKSLNTDTLLLSEDIKTIFRKMEERDRKILTELFLENGGQTMEELGKKMGICREAVRQRKEKAFAKFRALYGEE